MFVINREFSADDATLVNIHLFVSLVTVFLDLAKFDFFFLCFNIELLELSEFEECVINVCCVVKAIRFVIELLYLLVETVVQVAIEQLVH